MFLAADTGLKIASSRSCILCRSPLLNTRFYLLGQLLALEYELPDLALAYVLVYFRVPLGAARLSCFPDADFSMLRYSTILISLRFETGVAVKFSAFIIREVEGWLEGFPTEFPRSRLWSPVFPFSNTLFSRTIADLLFVQVLWFDKPNRVSSFIHYLKFYRDVNFQFSL